MQDETAFAVVVKFVVTSDEIGSVWARVIGEVLFQALFLRFYFGVLPVPELSSTLGGLGCQLLEAWAFYRTGVIL